MFYWDKIKDIPNLLLSNLQLATLCWKVPSLYSLKITSPDHSSTFCSASIAWLGIFNTDINNNEGKEAEEVEETNNCWENEGNVKNDHGDGSNVHWK